MLTCFNIYNLFARSPVREDLVDGLTFVLGPAFMALLWAMWSAPDWDVPLYTNMEPFFHAPLASWHLPTSPGRLGLAELCSYTLSGREAAAPPRRNVPFRY